MSLNVQSPCLLIEVAYMKVLCLRATATPPPSCLGLQSAVCKLSALRRLTGGPRTATDRNCFLIDSFPKTLCFPARLGTGQQLYWRTDSNNYTFERYSISQK